MAGAQYEIQAFLSAYDPISLRDGALPPLVIFLQESRAVVPGGTRGVEQVEALSYVIILAIIAALLLIYEKGLRPIKKPAMGLPWPISPCTRRR